MLTSNHQRWVFFLQTRTMQLWSAGIAMTCRTEIGYNKLRWAISTARRIWFLLLEKSERIIGTF
jgi:hypothetical protein